MIVKGGLRVKFLRCKEVPKGTGKRVVIVGAGPAGLAAAGVLRCYGHEVVIYDMMPEAGGMMMFGIPDDRLPKDRIRESVKELMRAGVRFLFNVKVGKDVKLDELMASSDAVLIATGTWKTRELGVEGEHLPWVLPAAEWIVEVHMARYGYLSWNHVYKPSGTALIVGAGLTAVDVATLLLTYPEIKGGVKRVVLSYRRTRDLAPMRPSEFEQLEKMGVEIMELTQPVKIYEEGGKRYVRLVKMRLESAPGEKRPRPVPIEGSEFDLGADVVFKAIGELPTPPFEKGAYGIELNPDGTIKVDENFMTTRRGVFAAGDVKTGPSLIGPAYKSGIDAAVKIHQYLTGGL
ncbi:MAG: FAD-dependent oxidoreductase [Acidilobaceae archaeon]|nr:FAD-dependent oxidoreductase [Acidilobaceae archaeon]